MRLAILASVALHAVAVGSMYVLFTHTPVPMAPEPVAEEPAIEMVAVPVSIEELTPPPPEPPPPQPPPPEPPKPQPPAPTPDAPKAVTSTAAADTPAVTPLAPLEPPAPPAPPAPPRPPTPAMFSGASDPSYYATVQGKLASVQRYPDSARRRRQEGTVLLWFVINPSGKVLAFRIDKPSGSAVLDEEVGRMIKAIQRFPPVPAQHRGHKRIEFRIPVNFRLAHA